jgi:hypothetical protein
MSHTVENASTWTGQNTEIAEVCYGSAQPFQENALLVFQITSEPLSSARFSLYYSLINSPFAKFWISYSDVYTVNLLKTKRNLLYIRNQSLPRSKHFLPGLQKPVS